MNRLLTWLQKNSGKTLAGIIGLYVISLSLICIWKYNQLLYNGLDLAIYNNTLWNTLRGNWFWSSIQGHNYFGDHFEPILILLLPLYSLWQSPSNLLIIQSIFLGLAAWPVYKIAKLKIKAVNPRLIALLWLINPLVHNVNLFEFHAIALLPFFFFWLFYFYLKLKEKIIAKKTQPCFYIFVILCLMVREDAALIISSLALVLMASDRKNKKLVLISGFSFLISIIWIIFSHAIIAHFSPSGASPFAYYYGWLASAKPLQVIGHIVNYKNFEMLLGFLLPWLLVPLLKPKWLLIAIIPAAQIILTRSGGGALVWQIHYAALFLPALMLAFIYSFEKANNYVGTKIGGNYWLIVFLLAANLYLSFQIGPFPPTAEQRQLNASNEWEEIKAIASDDAVIAGNKFLAALSGREHIYAFNYAYLGVQQFGNGKYETGNQIGAILIDENDALELYVHTQHLAWANKYFAQGKANWERYDITLLNGLMENLGNQKQARGGLEIDKMGSLKLVLDN